MFRPCVPPRVRRADEKEAPVLHRPARTAPAAYRPWCAAAARAGFGMGADARLCAVLRDGIDT